MLRMKLALLTSSALACAGPARAMNSNHPVITPEECERVLLSARAAAVHRDVVRGFDWLSQKQLVPVNFREPRVRREDIDPGFAEFKLGPDATVAELKSARREAAARRKSAYAKDLAGPLAESTPLSALQAAALGVSSFDERSDELTVRVARTAPTVLTLESWHGERLVGSIDLSLEPIELGYDGDIAYWTYKMMDPVTGEVPPVVAGHFIADNGVVVLRTVQPSMFAYVVRLAELDAGSGDDASVQIDVHTVRECPLEVARASLLQVPPFTRPDGRGRCFTPTGLKLLTFEVSNE